jgi:DNA-directed RNA polymerase specialized sigma24 family protein
MNVIAETVTELRACTPEQFGAWVEPHVRAMTLLAERLTSDAERDDVVQEAQVR